MITIIQFSFICKLISFISLLLSSNESIQVRNYQLIQHDLKGIILISMHHNYFMKKYNKLAFFNI